MDTILTELARQVAQTKALVHCTSLTQLEILANLSGKPMEEIHGEWMKNLQTWSDRYLQEMVQAIRRHPDRN